MSLAKKAVAGYLWTTGANVGSRVLTIFSTFILTRFLAPAEQGEVGAALVFIQTIAVATGLGVNQYVAANPKDGRDVVFHGTVLTLGAGLLTIVIALLAGGPIVGGFLDAPGAVGYVPALALSHFLDRCGWPARSVLVRDMRFRVVGIRLAVGETCYAASSVAFAALGWGGWAIVAGNFVRAVVALVFLFFVTNWRDYLQPCKIAWATLLKILKFGVPITLGTTFHTAAQQWDNGFMVRRFGETVLGLYNQAYRLADLPATSVGEQINDVLVPTFARVDDPEARKRGLLRACSLMALVVFPMAIGLGAVAKTLVEACYAKEYAGVTPFLAALATLSMARSIGSLATGFLQVVNRTRATAVNEFLLVVSVLLSMYLFAPLGSTWAAIGVGVAFTLNVLVTLRSLRPAGITITSVLLAIMRPAIACVPMAVAVLGVRMLLEPLGWPAWSRLFIELGAGAAAYILSIFIVARRVANDFLDLALGMVRRKRGAVPVATAAVDVAPGVADAVPVAREVIEENEKEKSGTGTGTGTFTGERKNERGEKKEGGKRRGEKKRRRGRG